MIANKLEDRCGCRGNAVETLLKRAWLSLVLTLFAIHEKSTWHLTRADVSAALLITREDGELRANDFYLDSNHLNSNRSHFVCLIFYRRLNARFSISKEIGLVWFTWYWINSVLVGTNEIRRNRSSTPKFSIIVNIGNSHADKFFCMHFP